MADDNVVEFPGASKLPVPVIRILKRAAKADLAEIVVCGYDKDGKFFFEVSSTANGDVLWCLELAKHFLISESLDEPE
jgi:hypothetical protein